MYGKRTVVESDIVALLSEVLNVFLFEKIWVSKSGPKPGGGWPRLHATRLYIPT